MSTKKSHNPLEKITRYNLCRIMGERGIKQVDLCRLTGKSSSHISQIVNGGTNIGVNTVNELAKALDVDPGEFYLPIQTVRIEPDAELVKMRDEIKSLEAQIALQAETIAAQKETIATLKSVLKKADEYENPLAASH